MVKIYPKIKELEDIGYEKKILSKIEENPSPYLRVIKNREGLECSRDLFYKSKEEFQRLILIGIGGSILGTEAIVDFCKDKVKNLYFLDNIDSKKIIQAKKLLKKGDYGVCVISKSGKTLETNLLFSTIFEDLKENFKDKWNKRVVVITASEKNPLGSWAKEEKISFLKMPEDLSGRFSVFSTVGTFPLLFENINLNELFGGANLFLKELKKETKKNLLLNLSNFLIKNKEKPLVLFTYGSFLQNLGRWFQQLWAESLGKEGKFSQIPFVAIGTQDQHSILQMLSDVPSSSLTWIWLGFESKKIFPDLSFIKSELKGLPLNDYLQMAAEGVFEALSEKGAKVLLLKINKRKEKFLGFLFSFFMVLTEVVSMKIGVNTFDQPAVELSKNITNKKLKDKIKNL